MTRVLPTIPPELVVVDEEEPCPYLPGVVARRPLRVPTRPLTQDELSARLAVGDRRSGPFFYNQECASCRACEPLRIDVAAFTPTRSQRRAARALENGVLTIELGPPVADDERVALFSKHEEQRGLRQRDRALDTLEYARFLVESTAPTFEIRYRLAATGQLVGVAITDQGSDALSAVYTFYDPDYAKLSLGTCSILTQLELCRAWEMPWLYLGLAVEGNAHMQYKLGWYPHERRIDGHWVRFERRNAPNEQSPSLDDSGCVR